METNVLQEELEAGVVEGVTLVGVSCEINLCCFGKFLVDSLSITQELVENIAVTDLYACTQRLVASCCSLKQGNHGRNTYKLCALYVLDASQVMVRWLLKLLESLP